uniref:Adenylyl cyclase-associated protein n=1 Tax=Leptobrachium leishanense TaxID=445787 RepID=A0A8C5PX42_9ANUR
VADMQNLVSRLEKAVEKLESLAIGSGGTSGSGDTAKFVVAFDALVDGPVAEFAKYSNEVGGDVEMVLTGIQLQRQIIVTASQCQQPAEKDLVALLAPLSNQILAVQNFREKNRGSKLFNHLSAVSESIPALGWVAAAPKPGPFVKEMMGAAMFYTNRVLKEYKDVNKNHVDWVRASLNLWMELQAYIKEHHTTGLSWSKTGPKAGSNSSAPSAPQAPKVGPGPPPPPPPVSRSKLFAELNQGAIITKGLKHVSDDQKTHKNPQVLGKVPTISINKTDGCHVYLSKGSLTCEIVSAKSSEMNILVPGKDGDFSEFPVPEQFKTVYNGQKLLSAEYCPSVPHLISARSLIENYFC